MAIKLTLQDFIEHMTGRRKRINELTAAIEKVQLIIDNTAADLRNRIAETQLLITNKVFELQNAIGHATLRIDAVELQERNLGLTVENAVENAELRLASAVGERSRDLVAETISRLLAIQTSLASSASGDLFTKPVSVALTFEDAVSQARVDFPRQFQDWKERLAAAEVAINETRVGNLAHWADPYSRAFKSFVELYAKGSILDVGCGTYGRPVYLAGIEPERLHGLEPLVLQADFDFPVIRGLGEYLPWQQGSFDTVVSATAIDHSLSLARALDEIVRVLAPDGTLLMWVGSIKGARAFKPDAPDYRPADRFHLFHIDREWFEPELECRFRIEDRVALWTPSHEHVFYKLKSIKPKHPKL